MIDSARHQWEEGRRRLEAEAHAEGRYHDLAALVDAVADELRRRVGQTFTLADLVREYERAEDWVRDVVVRETEAGESAPDPERRPVRAGVRDTALVQDAAFARFALGASDYRP